MRTETELDKREVLAIWMNGATSHYSGDSGHFDSLVPAVRESKLGKLAVKREMLITGRTDNFIVKNISVRRSCTAIFLDLLPTKLATDLQQSE